LQLFLVKKHTFISNDMCCYEDQINFMTEFKFKKAVQALNLFAQLEGNDINYMKAVKLIYIADKVHLRVYGRSITNDSYVAMKNGPVPSRTLDIIKKSNWHGPEPLDYSNTYLSDPMGHSISSINEVDKTVFSKTDLKIMSDVYEKYGNLKEFEISEFTHTFPEWLKFKPELTSNPKSRFPINTEDLFNSSNLNDDCFAQNDELLSLSKEHFQTGL